MKAYLRVDREVSEEHRHPPGPRDVVDKPEGWGSSGQSLQGFLVTLATACSNVSTWDGTSAACITDNTHITHSELQKYYCEPPVRSITFCPVIR